MKLFQSKTLEITLIVGAVLLALLLRTCFFYTSISFMPTSTDEALAALMAKSIYLGSRPLLFWGAPYQFPIESYLMAPFWPLLKTNAFGARVVLAALAALSTLGFCIVMWRAFRPEHRWPGLLLILLPSAYLMTLQSAYFIPEYTMTFACAWLIPLLTIQVLRTDKRLAPLCALGLICGLALSFHLLSLPLVAVTAVAACLGRSFRGALGNSLVFVLSFGVGLTPYLATLGKAQSSATSVTSNYPLAVALGRLFSDLPNKILEIILGFNVTLFPDLDRTAGVLPLLVTPGVYAFWSLLILCTVVSAYQFFVRSWKARWPNLIIQDVFVGTTWACILAFVVSTRARPDEYRYMLPLAWSLPFLFSYAYSFSAKYLKSTVAVFAVLMAGLNTANTYKVISAWQTPKFAEGLPELHDVSPIIAFLDKHGFTHCYASFWLVNRITYETDERIVCSQPYNERFLGWPLPYLDRVNSSSDAAYVLSDTRFSRLSASKFLKLLEFHRVAPTVFTTGVFRIIYDFEYRDVPRSNTVPAEQLQLTTSDINSQLNALIDGDNHTYWRSSSNQEAGMFVELKLAKAHQLHRIRLRFNEPSIEESPTYSVQLSEDGQNWTAVRSDITPTADRIKMTNKHPIFYRNARQDISFEPKNAVAVRVVVEQPKSDTPWELAEITLSEAAPATAE
ncbi:MAG: discoidin domain-containing protein [Bdellovibrionales bacterium]|nr:discoidin domain-containing protein [Bdellovibrionales bacterium]